jgi:hypothetical protein
MKFILENVVFPAGALFQEAFAFFLPWCAGIFEWLQGSDPFLMPDAITYFLILGAPSFIIKYNLPYSKTKKRKCQ